MKVLSLEESKEIIIKFLKYFGVYDKEKLEEYFKPSPPPKPTKEIPGCRGCLLGIGYFFRFMYKFLTMSLPPIEKNVYSDLNFEKYYGHYLYASEYIFEDAEEVFSHFCQALEKTFKENGINALYVIETNPKRLCFTKRLKNTLEAKRVISLSLQDVRDGVKIASADAFIFPENFSFLLSTDTDNAISIFGFKKIFDDFKKDFPEWRDHFLKGSGGFNKLTCPTNTSIIGLLFLKEIPLFLKIIVLPLSLIMHLVTFFLYLTTFFSSRKKK